MEKSLQQQSVQQEGAICPLCQQHGVSQEHFRLSHGVTNLDDKLTFFRIRDQGIICRWCFSHLSEEEWVKHRKSRKAGKCQSSSQPRSASQHNGTHTSLLRPQSLPQREQPLTATTIDKYRSEGHVSALRDAGQLRIDSHVDKGIALADLATSIITPLIMQWATKHNHVSLNVLMSHLSAAALDFGNSFASKPIVIPTWNTISRKGGKTFKWESFLQKPENLFKHDFLVQKLERLTERKKVTAIQRLNRLRSLYPNLIQQRKVPTVKMEPRIRGHVRIKDLLLLISTLLSCRRQRAVHFGLDLYIVLLSGQRFLADYKKIEQGVQQLLRENEQVEESVLHFTMIIGKTNLRHEVCLNLQLLKLLKAFKWEGFHCKTYRLIKRMRQWLGILGYALKDAMLTAAAAVASDVRISQDIAGHSSISNTFRYTSLSKVKDILAVTSRLAVPGVKPQFGSYDQPQLMEYLGSLSVSNVRYCTFYSDWLHQLFTRLYTLHYRLQLENDERMDFMLPSSEVPNLLSLSSNLTQPIAQQASNFGVQSDLERIERQLQILKAPRNEDSEENALDDIEGLLEQMEPQELIVYGIRVKVKENSFLQENFFETYLGHNDLYCFLCRKTIPASLPRLKCVYCEGNFHIDCPGLICKCTLPLEQLTTPPIPAMLLPHYQRASSIKIELPSKYSRGKYLGFEEQIRMLLAVRRFRYTRVAVKSPGLDLNLSHGSWKDIQVLSTKKFEAYLKGEYFPPIQARPVSQIAQHLVFGAQWGLFAVEDIAANVLIGEYACDLLHGFDLLLCRKPDSIMRYSGIGLPTDIFLGPRDYCGHVLLINGGTGKNCNCKVWRVIVEGCLRVILVTSTRVKKGQQLLYNYGQDYPLEIKEQAEQEYEQ